MPIFAPLDSPFFAGAVPVADAVADTVVAVDRVVGPTVLPADIVGVAVCERPWMPMMVWTSPVPRLKTPVPSEQLHFPAFWSDAQQNVLLPQGSTTASVVCSSWDWC